MVRGKTKITSLGDTFNRNFKIISNSKSLPASSEM